MKKLNALVPAILLCLAGAAQEKPKFGLKGGLNVSKLIYNNGNKTDWKTGLNLGALAHIHFTPAFSLQPEIYYSAQGAKLPYNNDKIVLNMSYINVPILLQYNFHNGVRLQAGPQVGFLTGVSDKLNGVELNAVNTKAFKTIDVSLPVGISYLAYSGFGVDARYNIGLTNVYKNGQTSAKNSVFQFGVFYLFDHNHKVKTSKPVRRR